MKDYQFNFIHFSVVYTELAVDQYKSTALPTELVNQDDDEVALRSAIFPPQEVKALHWVFSISVSTFFLLEAISSLSSSKISFFSSSVS